MSESGGRFLSDPREQWKLVERHRLSRRSRIAYEGGRLPSWQSCRS